MDVGRPFQGRQGLAESVALQTLQRTIDQNVFFVPFVPLSCFRGCICSNATTGKRGAGCRDRQASVHDALLLLVSRHRGAGRRRSAAHRTRDAGFIDPIRPETVGRDAGLHEQIDLRARSHRHPRLPAIDPAAAIRCEHRHVAKVMETSTAGYSIFVFGLP